MNAQRMLSGITLLLLTMCAASMSLRGDDKTLAWSGARWVPHRDGQPLTNVPVPSFANQAEANRHAMRCGFRILTE